MRSGVPTGPLKGHSRRGQHCEGEVDELGCAVERGRVILQAGLAIDINLVKAQILRRERTDPRVRTLRSN